VTPTGLRERRAALRGRPRRRDRGFTLLEVMLVLAILGFVMTLMWGSFSQTSRTKKHLDAAHDRLHTARTALMRIARELEMAYLSNAENTGVPQRRTFFQATSRADIDEIAFSSFAHQRLRAGANEGDTSVISYYGERDPDDRRVLNLMRRDSRRLQALDLKDLPGETYILCPNVVRLKFTFWDFRKKAWREDWTTLDATGFQYLPTHIKVTLTVLDDRGKEYSLSTDARIHVTERVDYRGAGVN
jgi:general secretion pathway protein J